ncbi:YesN/AraC family two-component response regulator [Hydrogenispora ethanolica]|uniref:YesN/AraC family two-component response regulator n=1 Tax=Hydrogenispora ethanolica TaxID=1082276 RepID=A0A4V2QD67_HYDET|nr:response regulator [Hydrogenispora ethanolica]TCL62587.1 YesN/AraC family two-component response regulator [Hydrogenispora ethanolica]
MYKILVVDDEKLLRQGLIHLTNWTEHGYIVTGEAANGIEALQFIGTNRPDIVITDIVMPVMGGIELIKKLREDGDNLPVIIVSSYSEFQYVREALQLGAVDYLLKQEISPASLLRVIEKARSKAAENGSDSSKTPSRKEEHLEQLFLSLLTTESMDKKIFFANISAYGFVLRDENLQLILLCPEQAAPWKDIKLNYPAATLKKAVLGCFHPELTPFIFFSSEKVITLLLNTSPADVPRIEAACIQAINQLNSLGNGAYVAALSETYSGIEQTRNIYFKTLPVAQFRFYDHAQLLFKFTEYEGKIDVPIVDYKQLAAWLEKSDFEGLYSSIAGYINFSLENERYFEPYELKKMLVEVFNYLLFYLSESGFEMTDIKENRFQYIKMIEDARSMPELLKDFKNITDLVGIKHTTGVKRYSELITGVIDYIKNNFGKDISLTTASSYLHVNKNYLCDLFKQQTGENFSDYLIHIRLEKAKEILKTSHLSIAVVGEQVGYPNPSYFAQLFKKHLGITPLEYRNLYRK